MSAEETDCDDTTLSLRVISAASLDTDLSVSLGNAAPSSAASVTKGGSTLITGVATVISDLVSSPVSNEAVKVMGVDTDMSPRVVLSLTSLAVGDSVDASTVTLDSDGPAAIEALTLTEDDSLVAIATHVGGVSLVVMATHVDDVSLICDSNDTMAGSSDISVMADICVSMETSGDCDVIVMSPDVTLSDVIVMSLGGVAIETSSRGVTVAMASLRTPEDDSEEMSGRVFRKSAGLRVSISSTDTRPP